MGVRDKILGSQSHLLVLTQFLDGGTCPDEPVYWFGWHLLIHQNARLEKYTSNTNLGFTIVMLFTGATGNGSNIVASGCMTPEPYFITPWLIC